MCTANLAIVFTDIKGFTERTSRQSYDENQRMLRLHEALLLPVFRSFEGRLIKTIGDAFMVVFPSPTKPAAVRAPLTLFASDLGVPLCAIGGVTLDNAPQLLGAGADLLAVITDLFEAPDIARRAAQYRELFA